MPHPVYTALWDHSHDSHWPPNLAMWQCPLDEAVKKLGLQVRVYASLWEEPTSYSEAKGGCKDGVPPNYIPRELLCSLQM